MNKKTLSKLFLGLGIFFGALLLIGTFWDLQIAKALYIENCRPAMTVAFAGFLLFFLCCTFLLGVLCRQLFNSGKKISRRVMVILAFFYLYLSTAVLFGSGVLNDQLFEGVFGSQVTLGSCLLTGSIFYIPVFACGVIANGRRYEKAVVKKTVGVIVIMTLVFLMSTYFNFMIIRPHFRLLSDPDAEFTRWYQLKGTGKLFMSISDLITAHPGSFTCGYAMYGILFLILFPSFKMVFPKLEGKEKILMTVAGILGAAVIFSRMITGDNYLSDICLGAVGAIKMCFSYALPKKSRSLMFWRKRNDGSSSDQIQD